MASSTGTTSLSHDSIIDWRFAGQVAGRLIRPGPDVSREQVADAVADLRAFASVAEGHVRNYTRLHSAASPAPVLVVDRHGWARANADSFAALLTPLTEKIQRKRAENEEDSSTGSGFGSRVTGLEAGAVLAYMSGKVLGQFDPFWTAGEDEATGEALDGSAAETSGADLGEAAGRLLLVAPNVVHVERELDVDPRDFRLWVCLHEETHRVQFMAVPWLRGYLEGEIRVFLEEAELDPRAMLSRLRGSFDQFGRAIRGGSAESSSVLDLLQTPTQRATLDRLTAVMSLLEGHAEVVMDGVGPEVIPTVADIRERFQRRRTSGSWGDQLIKRLLGLDAKLRQYRDGARFVRHVVSQVGIDGLNQVWTSRETLPTKAEISDPDAWLRRVDQA